MRSLIGAFPDARVLLALDLDQLSGFFLFIFKNLPWRDPRAVRRCVAHWAEPYPAELRGCIIDTIVAAWERLRAEGFLDEPVTPIESSPQMDRAIRLSA